MEVRAAARANRIINQIYSNNRHIALAHMCSAVRNGVPYIFAMAVGDRDDG
jgi:hypothetical protein